MNRTRLLVASTCFCFLACGRMPEPTLEGEGTASAVAVMPQACDLTLPPGTSMLVAGGAVVIQLPDGVSTATGDGCALEFGAPVPTGLLLDVDDEGAFYATIFGRVGSWVYRYGADHVGQQVASSTDFVAAFGVAPSGRTMWLVDGRTGPGADVLTVATQAVVFSAPTAEGALPDDEHLWYLDAGRLMVATTTGSSAVAQVGTTTRLARCGHDVCTFDGSSLTRWVGGVARRTETLETLGARDGEIIDGVAASRSGLYVTLRSAGTNRVRFIPSP